MKKLPLALPLLAALLLIGAVGDELRIRTSPPATRPAKLDKLRPAVDQTLAQAVTFSIERVPANAEAVSGYFREIGRVFAAAETNVDYSPIGITLPIAKFPPPLNDDGYAKEVTTLIVTLYDLAYLDRNKAEFPPLEWLSKVCIVFRNAINNAIKDTGRVGI